jgi:T4 RnlA family RNA ligase
LNERPETNVETIDFNRPFICLDKMDGSLICPIMLRGGDIRYVTMLGFSVQAKAAEEHVRKYQGSIYYNAFSKFCIERGMTPMFEFLSREYRIIIKYPEDQLMLLSVRDNESGEYCGYDQIRTWAKRYQIPCVQKWDYTPSTGKELIQHVRRMTGVEGCVVVFTDNHEMYKCKTAGYTMAHGMNPYKLKEHILWNSVLTNVIDDVVSLIDIDGRIRNFIQKFRDILQTALEEKANWITRVVERYIKSDTDQKKKMEQSLNTHENAILEIIIPLLEQNNEKLQSDREENFLLTTIEKTLEEYLLKKLVRLSVREFQSTKGIFYTWLRIDTKKFGPFFFETTKGILKLNLKLIGSSGSDEYFDLYEKLERKQGNTKTPKWGLEAAKLLNKSSAPPIDYDKDLDDWEFDGPTTKKKGNKEILQFKKNKKPIQPKKSKNKKRKR